MPLKPINHYSIESPVVTVHDEEAMTALQLAGRTAGKVNECVVAFNELEKETNKHLEEQDVEITNRVGEIPLIVNEKIADHIEGGTFDAQINEYTRDLEGRLNNFLESVPEGGTVMDSEVIDVRYAINGELFECAGEAVRAQAQNGKHRTENKDVFIRTNLIKGYTPDYFIQGNRTIVPSAGLGYTDPIFLEAGDYVYVTYYYLYGTNRNAFKWGESGPEQTINPLETSDTWTKFEIPTSGFYVFNIAGSGGAVCYDVNDLADTRIGVFMPDGVLDQATTLRGKRLAFTGDSICAGDGFAGGYPTIIGETVGCDIINIAKGGATITNGLKTNNGNNRFCISESVLTLDSSADFAIVEGGVNDAAMEVEMGTISTGYEATLNDKTFCGAFEKMCKNLVTRFAGKKVGYIFPHKMTGRFDSSNGSNYYHIAKTILEKWGVPYLDLNVECPAIGYISSLKSVYTKDGDGWHPNEDGYKTYYVPRIISWLNTL